MNKDKIFTQPITKQFEFDNKVATVFDDMLDRSVPFYKEVISLTSSYLAKYVQEKGTVLDLGCSTANTLLALKERREDLALVGVDNSSAMLAKAKEKAEAFGAEIQFFNQDLTSFSKGKYDGIIANYTLQFIRPIKREKCVKNIFHLLEDQGVFIFSEKVISENKQITKTMIDLYHEYKLKNGYSQYEISAKREALENVLIPYTDLENKKMILDAGFRSIETIFRWNNFATFIAIK